MGQVFKLLFRNTDLKLIGQFRLQQQRRDERYHVGIAAALPKPVKRALDLPHTRAHGGECISHSIFRIVVTMNAEPVSGEVFRQVRHDLFNLMGQRTAIRVTEDRPACAFSECCLHAGTRIIRIGLIAIEKMLTVDHGLAAPRDDRAHAICDGLQIFVIGDAERDIHVKVPAFGDKTHGRG